MKVGTYLADCAARYPEKVAATCGECRTTFAQLDRRANQLAHALAGLGQRIGDRVALYLPNGIEVVEAMAAIARSGGIIVPISTRLAAEEVRFILADSGARIVCFDPAHRDVAAAAMTGVDGAALIAVGDPSPGEHGFEALLAAASPEPPTSLGPDVDDLVLGYTSGTTGTPKGAIGTHRGMITVHGYMNPVEYEMTRDDVILITSPMAHRVGLSRVVNMLCLGCSIVIMPRFEPGLAVDLIEREGVSSVSVVPTIARLMLPEIERRPEACRGLRKLYATGEAFPVALKERLRSALPHLELFTSYAQTESGFVTCLRPHEQLTHPESVGRPVPGVEVRIVDEHLVDVPGGTPGEVLVRFGAPGAHMVMREYYRRPEANAEAFLAGGWLRTGDVCRRDPAGYLYFVDRLKDMIVSGGLNVYAKEVELALTTHPAVADAAVFGVPDPEFGEAVTACIELEEGSSASAEELIAHCRERIASYKKPRHVRFVDRLPRTLSGKVRKGELRASIDLAASSRASE